MDRFELKDKFTEEFFEEFWNEAEFNALFNAMSKGMTPYEAIEYLCRSNKDLFKALLKEVNYRSTTVMAMPEDRLDELKLTYKR